jgi:hypothetical protein
MRATKGRNLTKKSQKLIFHVCAEKPLADGFEPNLVLCMYVSLHCRLGLRRRDQQTCQKVVKFSWLEAAHNVGEV